MSATSETEQTEPLPRKPGLGLPYVGFGLGLLSLLCYLLVQQGAAYGDAPQAILEINAGAEFRHARHLLYMPILVGLRAVLSWTSMSLFEIGCFASALGTALGVVSLFAAARRLGERDPLLVGALVAACPSIVFFATTMEYHGPFFAFAAFATYLMARLVERPTLIRAVLVGVGTSFAYLAHASGHLLPATLGLGFLALCAPTKASWRQRIGLVVVVGIAHLLMVQLELLVLRGLVDTPGSSESALRFLVDWSKGHSYTWELWPKTFWYELLWPYLPLSLAWLLALRSTTTRSLVWALVGLGLLYFAMSMALVPGYNEHGAYQAPLAFFLAVATMRVVSRRVGLVLLVIGASVSLLHIWLHDDPKPAREFSAGFRQVTQNQASSIVIGGDFIAFQACAQYLRDVEVMDIHKLISGPEPAVRRFLVYFDRQVADRVSRGVHVVFSAGAWKMLSLPAIQGLPGAAVFQQHVVQNYRMQPLAAAGFEGWLLQPR